MDCDVCLIEWDSVRHIPRILSCGHTICEECLLSMFDKNNSEMFCPSCMTKQASIKCAEDIRGLIKNINLLRISEKLDSRKNCMNSITSFNNTNLSMSSALSKNSFFNIKRANELICKSHSLPIHSYAIGTNVFFCDLCTMDPQLKIVTLPNYVKESKNKIQTIGTKINLLKQEIDKIEEFFKFYKIEFEKENEESVEVMFSYIRKIVELNYLAAKSVIEKCKKEQFDSIAKKLNEIENVKKEIEEIKSSIEEFKKNDDLFLVKSNVELSNMYNKVHNMINYDMEISLFQTKVKLNENFKEQISEIIQTSYDIDIEYILHNNQQTLIKDILQKDKIWSCVCGENENLVNNLKCTNCGLFRKHESFENILYNPTEITKEELKFFNARKKQEVAEFQKLYKNTNNSKEFYAIDIEWFLFWKCYVTNDQTAKYISNSKKGISIHKSIGVLPPFIITNSNLFEKNCQSFTKNKLRQGLIKNDDYLILNRELWEFFKNNYGSHIDIVLNSNIDIFVDFVKCIIEKEGNTLINDNNEFENNKSFDDDDNTDLSNTSKK
jgi:hypothetical protein